MDINKADLDRYITGNYGEDQFKESRYIMNLTFQEFKEVNEKRCNDVFHPINSWKLHDWAIALIGEFGEAMNILKKIKRVNDGTDPLSDLNVLYPALMEEIADIVTYADLLLTSEGYSLEEELVKKFNKVSDKRGSDIKL